MNIFHDPKRTSLALVVMLLTAIGLTACGNSQSGEKKGGDETWEGAAKRTADEIAKELKKIFQAHGWI